MSAHGKTQDIWILGMKMCSENQWRALIWAEHKNIHTFWITWDAVFFLSKSGLFVGSHLRCFYWWRPAERRSSRAQGAALPASAPHPPSSPASHPGRPAHSESGSGLSAASRFVHWQTWTGHHISRQCHLVQKDRETLTAKLSLRRSFAKHTKESHKNS